VILLAFFLNKRSFNSNNRILVAYMQCVKKNRGAFFARWAKNRALRGFGLGLAAKTPSAPSNPLRGFGPNRVFEGGEPLQLLKTPPKKRYHIPLKNCRK
jgi:hypothetical protein